MVRVIAAQVFVRGLRRYGPVPAGRQPGVCAGD